MIAEHTMPQILMLFNFDKKINVNIYYIQQINPKHI